MSAGIVMNLIAAFALFSASYALVGKRVNHGENAVIVELVSELDSARQAGLHVGDLVTSINAQAIANRSEFSAEMSRHANQAVKIQVMRQHELKELLVNTDAQGRIGVVLGGKEIQPAGCLESVTMGAKQTGYVLEETLNNILVLARLKAPQIGSHDNGGQLHGVIAVVQVGADALSKSLAQFVYVAGVLNINLALLNMLPLPVLDGGQLVFIALEKLRGKPLSKETQGTINLVFVCILLALAFLAMYNDIFHPLKLK